jgi:Protein of unknown function (DUF3024)
VALSELEAARIKRSLDAFLEGRRPPPHIRRQVDLGYRISGHSVEIFEIRPAFGGGPGEKSEHAVAKATFVRTRAVWRILWQRADLKWHTYEPVPAVGTIEAFLKIVSEDTYSCFFG